MALLTHTHVTEFRKLYSPKSYPKYVCKEATCIDVDRESRPEVKYRYRASVQVDDTLFEYAKRNLASSEVEAFEDRFFDTYNYTLAKNCNWLLKRVPIRRSMLPEELRGHLKPSKETVKLRAGTCVPSNVETMDSLSWNEFEGEKNVLFGLNKSKLSKRELKTLGDAICKFPNAFLRLHTVRITCGDLAFDFCTWYNVSTKCGGNYAVCSFDPTSDKAFSQLLDITKKPVEAAPSKLKLMLFVVNRPSFEKIFKSSTMVAKLTKIATQAERQFEKFEELGGRKYYEMKWQEEAEEQEASSSGDESEEYTCEPFDYEKFNSGEYSSDMWDRVVGTRNKATDSICNA